MCVCVCVCVRERQRERGAEGGGVRQLSGVRQYPTRTITLTRPSGRATGAGFQFPWKWKATGMFLIVVLCAFHALCCIYAPPVAGAWWVRNVTSWTLSDALGVGGSGGIGGPGGFGFPSQMYSGPWIGIPLPSVKTTTSSSAVRIASGLWDHGAMIWNSSLYGPVAVASGAVASTTSLFVVQWRSVQRCVISAANSTHCSPPSLLAVGRRSALPPQLEVTLPVAVQESWPWKEHAAGAGSRSSREQSSCVQPSSQTHCEVPVSQTPFREQSLVQPASEAPGKEANAKSFIDSAQHNLN